MPSLRDTRIIMFSAAPKVARAAGFSWNRLTTELLMMRSVIGGFVLFKFFPPGEEVL